MPANWVFARIGMRRWMAVLMIAWGSCSAATALVTGPVTLTLARMALGAAEAGFYPAVICYLRRWFPPGYRAGAMAVFLLAIPVANTIGMPTSSLLVEHAAVAGWPGWRVMFVAEALPVVALAGLAARGLPDDPSRARWLSAAEREWLIRQEHAESDDPPLGFAAALCNRRVLVLAAINGGLYFALYAVQFFLPQILAQLFPHASVTAVGWLGGGCYALAGFMMVAWSRHSDHTAERVRHLTIAALIGAIVLAVAVGIGTRPLVAIGVVTAAGCTLAAIPVFWNIVTLWWSGTTAAAGVAAVNTLGSVASFLGPFVTGSLTATTGGFGTALLAVAACLALTGITAGITGRAHGCGPTHSTPHPADW